MKNSTIEKLCCPFDLADLSLQVFSKNIHSKILEGMLTCSQCGRQYPIVHGVPIMAPDEYRQNELEQPILQKWALEYKLPKDTLI